MSERRKSSAVSSRTKTNKVSSPKVSNRKRQPDTVFDSDLLAVFEACSINVNALRMRNAVHIVFEIVDIARHRVCIEYIRSSIHYSEYTANACSSSTSCIALILCLFCTLSSNHQTHNTALPVDGSVVVVVLLLLFWLSFMLLGLKVAINSLSIVMVIK